MEIKPFGQSALQFRYDELKSCPTYVYLLEKKTAFYLLDTFCGSASMAAVLERVRAKPEKPLIVINTHSHWDHVWGNCSFPDSRIIAHERCRAILEQDWEEPFAAYGTQVMGRADKRLPDWTFSERLCFPEDGIELFYSPGHTSDSLSLYDHEERILYAGDNLEKPLIYVESPDLAAYIVTLRHYLDLLPQRITAGHTAELTLQDIADTLDYLENLQAGRPVTFECANKRRIHEQNLQTIHAGFAG